jgi:soluble lytic murein transglycosylase-like protein
MLFGIIGLLLFLILEVDMDIGNDLLEAIIQIESSGNPLAFNQKSGARGLMQTTPIAWKDLVTHYPETYKKLKYEQDIFKPDVSKRAGKDYLNVIRNYLKTYKIPETLDNVLGAYNFGIGNLRKYGVNNAPQETKDYISKIKLLLKLNET